MNRNKGKIPSLLGGTLLGGLLTFFSDPHSGNLRKSLVRDKSKSFLHHTGHVGGKIFRNLKNHSSGLKARAMKKFSKSPPVSDDVLLARVRSAFGRVVSHPKSVQVYVKDGIVTLSGLILAKEVNQLFKSVRKVKGVRALVDEMDVYERSEHVSGLQGSGPEYLS